MTASTLLQIIAACTGVVGSLFFAIGIMRQTVEAMADLSGTYFSWNPHMISALAAQKADYLFGGGIIVMAFALQLFSFFVPSDVTIAASAQTSVPWVALAGTAITFVILRRLANSLASKFEAQIRARLKTKEEEFSR